MPAGWYGNDYISRRTERAAYIAKGANLVDLCASSSLYLDSFTQVGGRALGPQRMCRLHHSTTPPHPPPIRPQPTCLLLLPSPSQPPTPPCPPSQLLEDPKFNITLLQRTIGAYANLTGVGSLPSVDRQNLWVILQSRVAGYNLAPYYNSWGWPVSAATEANVSSLPKWGLNPYVPPSPPAPPSPPFPPMPPPVDRCATYKAIVTQNIVVNGTAQYTQLLTWGAQATPLVGEKGRNYYSAAAIAGRGKAFAVGHEAIMWWTTSQYGDFGVFVKSAVLWLAGLGASGGGPKSVCYSKYGNAKSLVDHLVTLVRSWWLQAGVHALPAAA